MTVTINWGVLLLAAQKFVEDVKENRAPPAPDSAADFPTLAVELSAALPQWQAAWTAHRGVVTGLSELLQALADNGVPYAAMARNALLTAPGAMSEAEKWLSEIEWILMRFQPAATGIQGDGPRVGRG